MKSKTRFLTRMLVAVFPALMLAGATVATQASAAGALNGAAQVAVQYGNNTCGGVVMGAPEIGSVRFVRVGDQLTFRYVMDMGDPNTDYAVHLFDGDTCTSLGKVGSFSTDAAGAGRTVSRRVNVAGRDRFYAAAIDLTTFVGIPHGSYAVDLP
jgi:hypothetical protein